jgi:hypothetical protein
MVPSQARIECKATQILQVNKMPLIGMEFYYNLVKNCKYPVGSQLKIVF